MLGGIKLIECFRTFQGEGPDSGRAMLLLRFKYCDQNCSFCDTKVKMRISEEGEHTQNALQMQLDSYRLGLMITGGEPTFEKHYRDTMTLLSNLRYTVANVETNGCQLEKMLKERDWTTTPVKFIYSPKIFDEKSGYKAITLTNTILDHPNVYIKVPYMKNGHVDTYCKWVAKEISERETYNISKMHEFNHKVWLMPIGSELMEQEESSADVMDACEEYRFNFSGRTHIMYNFI
jgi:organic radical activating enzyme